MKLLNIDANAKTVKGQSRGFSPVHAMQSRSRIPGKAAFTKHIVRFTHPTAASVQHSPAVGDVIPQLVLKNAHDGTAAYELSLGLFRLRCLNGLMVCTAMFAEIRVPHMGNVRGRVIDGAFSVIENSGKAIEHAQAWSNKQLTLEQRLQFASAALAIRFPEGSPVTPNRA